MSFASLWYLPLLIAIAVFCHFMPVRLKPYFLLGVSWILYGLFGLPYFLLLVMVTGTGYICGILLDGDKKGRRLVLIGGVLLILGILFWAKYLALFLSGITLIGRRFQIDLKFSEIHTILPVGISFYTFQSLSYLIDVYRGQKGERNFVLYALYICFFPQLVAGPIEQSGKLIPQLKGKRTAQEDVFEGVKYLLDGYIRKFVIADYMAGFVDAVYANAGDRGGVELLFATFLFAVQIYCDFAGYTHIAIGSARLLGIRLNENFDRPYLAAGCKDFWERWHITLTKWFTEYVYIPLGGNRKGAVRKCVNIFTVFVLSGLWHGPNLTFLCWGAFFGIWRILEEIAGRVVKKGSRDNLFRIRMKRAFTFSMVCIAWVFFRSQSMSEAAVILVKIFTLAGSRAIGIGAAQMAGIAARVGVLALLSRFLQLSREREGTVVSCYIYTVLLLLAAVCMLAIFQGTGTSSFIYFQF